MRDKDNVLTKSKRQDMYVLPEKEKRKKRQKTQGNDEESITSDLRYLEKRSCSLVVSENDCNRREGK